jgi:hypothetical protein
MHSRSDSRYDNTRQRLTRHAGDAARFGTPLEAEHCASFLQAWGVLKNWPVVERLGPGWTLRYLVDKEKFYVADPNQ